MATQHIARQQTNPRYASFTQSVFTAGDEEQFEEKRMRTNLANRSGPPAENMFSAALSLLNWDQVGWEGYEAIDSRAVSDTFNYIFQKFKKGIFVRISGSPSRLDTFLPFSNAHFRNEFAHLLKVDPSRFKHGINEFLAHVSSLQGMANVGAPYKPSRALPLDEWVANDAMFRFEPRSEDGDHNMLTLKDLFETLAMKRTLPDIEFFINRRDFPLLKMDGTEPYTNLFGNHRRLLSHNYAKFAPILSGSSAVGFADVAMPTYEDWARATFQIGRKMPDTEREYPRIKHSDWNKKRPVAVFRGSTTGAGTTPLTNQRLRAFEIGQKNKDLLDVGFTKWNLRPRKFETDKFLSTIERDTYPRVAPLTLQDQADSFKYILNLEGHVAAYRLTYELSSGSVVLLADSKWRMWIHRFIKPFEHFVPIKRDLSDLVSQIEWCRSHDAECQKIAANAKRFYDEFLGVDGILDFMQHLLFDLSRTTGIYDYLPSIRDMVLADERKWLLSNIVFNDDQYVAPMAVGPRCVGRLDASLNVLRSRSTPDPTFVRTIYKSASSVVDLLKTHNDIAVVRKMATTAQKAAEIDHEAFVGLRVINGIVAKCPNFVYTFGSRPGVNAALFSEYISGATLKEWIRSDAFNFRDLLRLLVQISVALQTAQTFAGVVIHDLHCSNVIVQTLRQETSFDYNIGESRPVRIKTALVPILIDFGKTRVVVFDEKRGMVDHGTFNLLKAHRLHDTMTLLYAVCNLLTNDVDKRALLEFAHTMRMPANLSDVAVMKRFGAVAKLLNDKDDDQGGPMTFVEFIERRFNLVVIERVRAAGEFNQRMDRGNCFLESATMRFGGDRKKAVLATVARMNKQTAPHSPNAVVRMITSQIVERRLKEIDDAVRAVNDPISARKWDKVRTMFSVNFQPKLDSDGIVIDWPQVRHFAMDSEITPAFVKHFKAEMTETKEDWATILSMCSDAGLHDDRLDIFGAHDKSGFLFLGELASNNTLLWIADNAQI